MADKTPNDAESLPTHEEKRKKRMKWAVYIAVFAVFQVAVILVFVLVVMKVRTPKFRVGEFQIQSLDTAQTPSFNATFLAPIRVKNNNFGPYKYDATAVNFTYGGVQVGNVTIPKSKANFMSTKKIDLNVTLSSGALPSSANSTLRPS
ncbi:hypothetical protein NL676_010139 [Syzygium grande]|nr:hypothetical protein NL676_010139 [Syzygium grande]